MVEFPVNVYWVLNRDPGKSQMVYTLLTGKSVNTAPFPSQCDLSSEKTTFSPPRECRRRGDAGFLITVGHSLCHFQENCGVSATTAWPRAAPSQPSPGHAGEVLARLWLSASGVASVFSQHVAAGQTSSR